MNEVVKMLVSKGDVCLITERHMIVVSANDKEVVVEVTDQYSINTLAEMTLELPS